MKNIFRRKIFNLFRKKVRSDKGETIAETLVTMIILSLAVLMLAGAVVTAARVNKKADNTDTAFTKSTTNPVNKTVVITYTGKDGKDGTEQKLEINTDYYETENAYKYYEAK